MVGVRKVAIEARREGVNKTLTGGAAAYLRWETARHGVEIVSPADAEVILVSLIDLRGMPMVRRVRRQNKNKRIVVGGVGGFSPFSVGKVADAVVVGEGRGFLQALYARGYEEAVSLPNVWVDGETRRVVPDAGYPWDFPPVLTEGGITVALSRGCKNRCRFCQIGWSQRFVEHPNPDRLCNQLSSIRYRKKGVFQYVTNDLIGLSFYRRLPRSNFASVSLALLRKGYIPQQNMVRIGVEGVSARLRKTVAKPFSLDDLVAHSVRLSDMGKTVKWFMIAGLPGETDDDWLELREAVQQWKRYSNKSPLELSFCSFIPMASTPFSAAALHDDYVARWEKFDYWFFHGHGFSNRVFLYGPGKPEARNKLAVLETGLPLDELRNDRPTLGPNGRVVYPYEEICQETITRTPWRKAR